MDVILTYERLNWLQSKVVKSASEHGYLGDVWADHPPCRYQSELTEPVLILIDARLGELSSYERELTKRWATAAVMNHQQDRERDRTMIDPVQSTPTKDHATQRLTAKDLISRRSAV